MDGAKHRDDPDFVAFYESVKREALKKSQQQDSSSLIESIDSYLNNSALFSEFNLLFLLFLVSFCSSLYFLRRVLNMSNKSNCNKIVCKPKDELLERQSEEQEHEEDEVIVRKSRLFPTTSSDDCMRFLFPDCKTLAQVMERGTRASLGPNYDCLGSLKLIKSDQEEDSDEEDEDDDITPTTVPDDVKLNEEKEEEEKVIPVIYYGKKRKAVKAPTKLPPKSRQNYVYHFDSYSKVSTRINKFASGLMSEMKHLIPRSSKVGIYATNCADYVVCELGCYEHSLIVVPLYDTLGPNAVSFVMKEAGISVVIVDSEERFSCILSQFSAPSTLKTIILINQSGGSKVFESLRSKARGLGLNVYTMKQVERIGSKAETIEPTKPRPRDLAVICYTSGTTGNPKGAMLTHENIISNLSSVLFQLGDQAPGPSDTYMSFLPLAHMFERCSVAASLMVGARIGFFGGNIKELSAEMEILQPTFVPSVPRLFNRIYDKVYSQVSRSKMKRWMLRKGLEAKTRELEAGIYGSRESLWDKLIFNKVKDGMGGKVRLIVVGSAPTSPAVLHFMRCALSAVICEGYGQTECVCPCTCTLPGDVSTGHVGPPLASAYIKLLDVPEMNYFARDNQGEVCVKGPIVFQGYLGAKTPDTDLIDNEGWLHTGDIGTWNPNGTLSIIDRKKHIFKLSQGEFISPEKIESVYARSRFVAQIFVYGESIKSSLVAIIVPDLEVLMNWARDHHHSNNDKSEGDISRLCTDLKVKQVILEDLYALGRKDGALKGFEQVRDIYLTHEPFTIQNGLLTPTLKTKRPACRKHFGSQIEEMYRGLD